MGDAVQGALPLREALGLRLGVGEAEARGEAVAWEAEGDSVDGCEAVGGVVPLRVTEAQLLAVGGASVGVTLLLALELGLGDGLAEPESEVLTRGVALSLARLAEGGALRVTLMEREGGGE